MDTSPRTEDLLRSDEQLAQDKESQQKDLSESPVIPTIAVKTRSLELDADVEKTNEVAIEEEQQDPEIEEIVANNEIKAEQAISQPTSQQTATPPKQE